MHNRHLKTIAPFLESNQISSEGKDPSGKMKVEMKITPT